MKLLPRRVPDWRATGSRPASEAACLASVWPELWHVGDERDRGNVAKPRNAGQDHGPAGETGISRDQGSRLRVEGIELARDLVEASAAWALEQVEGERFGAVGGGGSISELCSPGRDVFAEP